MLDWKGITLTRYWERKEHSKENHCCYKERGHCRCKRTKCLFVSLHIPQYNGVLCDERKTRHHQDDAQCAECFSILSKMRRIVDGPADGEPSHHAKGNRFANTVEYRV